MTTTGANPAATQPRPWRGLSGWLGSTRGTSALLLAPSLALLLVFMVIPLITIFFASLESNVLLQFAGPGVDNYKYLLTRAYYFNVLIRTIRIALVGTALTLPLGYAAAMMLPILPSRIINTAIMTLTFPILAGPLVIILGWMTILPDRGPLFGPLVRVGWIGPPHILGSETAIVLSLVQFTLPFAILTLYTTLKEIPRELYEAAQSLGAGTTRCFLHVTLPMSLPGVLSTTIIVFSLSSSSFISPHYLGGAADVTLTTLIEQFVLSTYNSPLAGTASILLLLIMLGCILLFVKLFGWFIRP